ncbi:RTA1 like protein [Pseudomassariella vexata]|uniref:RTA1 like protein n=1 Tax=Pseudomassariella vexata TaxID=1141098 RepID=A0A1Y2E0R8_9PEZI|nr:RTA1 like protein [Pseudomassariella vexata]ORY65143.1 RTA1 like protein [Pseudomassariella vexata]
MVRQECTEVGPYCPVEYTVLSYYPNLAVNVVLCVGFGLCALGIIGVGVWKKTWGYSAALAAGCILEMVGYVGRIQLHSNPWDSKAFETQICAIILAPTLICISIYLILKHITMSVNPALSRIRPRLYPIIFVPADISCLVLQATGGSMAAVASSGNLDLLLAGDRVIIAGIALQVVVLGCFALMCFDYWLRARKWVKTEEATAKAKALWMNKRFRIFCYAVSGALGGILIRCIYRIAEMAGGWGSPIMQDEPSFIVLEGFMILIPVILLTIFQPGLLFPAMAERESLRFEKKSKNEQPVVSSNATPEDLEHVKPQRLEKSSV